MRGSNADFRIRTPPRDDKSSGAVDSGAHRIDLAVELRVIHRLVRPHVASHKIGAIVLTTKIKGASNNCLDVLCHELLNAAGADAVSRKNLNQLF